MELFCQWGKGSQTFEIGWDLKADEQKGILDLFVNRMCTLLLKTVTFENQRDAFMSGLLSLTGMYDQPICKEEVMLWIHRSVSTSERLISFNYFWNLQQF